MMIFPRVSTEDPSTEDLLLPAACSPVDKSISKAGAPGFTLIELIVSLGVICILSMLLMAGMNSSRKKVDATLCMTNLRQVYSGVVAYAGDNNGFLPRAYEPEAGVWPMYTWMYKIAPYIYKGTIDGSGDSNLKMCFSGFLRCPGKSDWKIDSPTTDQRRISYTMNTFNVSSEIAAPVKTVSLASPKNTLLVAETQSGNIAVVNKDWLYGTSYGPALRHGGKDNILFCDGHVAATPKDSFNYDLTLKNPN